jgi:hypothetical protein
LPFTVVTDSGLSTLEPRYAEKWSVLAPTSTITVKTKLLADICRQYVPIGAEIDFLKIDVEGWEAKVIAGGEWSRFRPRVLCIEATEPCTEIPAWEDWEPALLGYGYTFESFDGTNRFYVRS